MKRTLIITVLCLCVPLAMLGCGKKKPEPSKATSPTEEITETVSINSPSDETGTEEPEKEEKTDATEPTTEIKLQNNPSTAQIPPEAGSMLEIAHALALCESDMETSYSSTDTSFFWNATAYLIAGYGMQSAAASIDEEGNLSLPSSAVKEYASAIFSEFNGNSDNLPDIPENVTAISYDADTDSYSVGAGGFSSTKINCIDCIANGETYYNLTVELEVNDESEPQKLGKWEMTIIPSTYNGSGHPLFNYTVASFLKAD